MKTLNKCLVIIAIIVFYSIQVAQAQWSTNGTKIYYNTGEVGIGVTSPSAPLHTKGSASTLARFERTETHSVDAGIKIRGARSGSISSNIAFIDLENYDNDEGSGTAFVMGRVGAGMQDASGGTGYLRFYTNSGGSLVERMRIDKNGWVGIGTTAPQTDLHIATDQFSKSANTFNGDLFISSTGMQGEGQFGSAISFSRINQTRRSAAIASKQTGSDNDSGGLSFLTHGSTYANPLVERMVLNHLGNLGIGTASPFQRLDVVGVTYLRGAATHSVTSEQLRFGRADMDVRYHSIYSNHTGGASSNRLEFRIHDGASSTTQTTAMTLTGQGYMGIGTTSPGNVLDVEKNHNGNTWLEVTNSDDGNAARRGILIGNGTSGHHVMLTSTSSTYSGVSSWDNSAILSTESQLSNGLVLRAAAGNVRFQAGGTTDQMVFTPAGRLGIGTSTPDAELTVNGMVHTKQLLIDLNIWADFVFEEGYALPSLQSVEKHIEEKGHLPGMPSAQEVQENGVDVGAMNVKLLQKIEELTLYILDQEERIKKLEASK